MYYDKKTLMDLEECQGMSGLSGRDISVPGDTSVFATGTTVADPNFIAGNAAAWQRGGSYNTRYAPGGQPYAPGTSIQVATGPGGPTYYTMPGAPGGGGGGGAPDYSMPSDGGGGGGGGGGGYAPRTSELVVGGPGIALAPQKTGPQVSTGASTLDFSQYFTGGSAPAQAPAPAPTATPTPTQRPNTKPAYPRPNVPGRKYAMEARFKRGLKDYETNDVMVHLVLLAGLLYLIGKVRIPKE